MKSRRFQVNDHSVIIREVMTVIYVADGTKITPPKNKWQENDHRTWPMGFPVGAPVAPELNSDNIVDVL